MQYWVDKIQYTLFLGEAMVSNIILNVFLTGKLKYRMKLCLGIYLMESWTLFFDLEKCPPIWTFLFQSLDFTLTLLEYIIMMLANINISLIAISFLIFQFPVSTPYHLNLSSTFCKLGKFLFWTSNFLELVKLICRKK